MKNLSLKMKIIIISALVIILAGMVVLGVCGFNQTVDFSKGYEIEVTVDENLEGADTLMKDTADAYFKDNGIKHIGYAFAKAEDGTLIYKFDYDISGVDGNALQTAINDAFAASEGQLKSLTATVKVSTTVSSAFGQAGYIALALGIAAIAVFIYLFFAEKLSGAFTVLCSSVVSGTVFMALLSLVRISAEPYVAATAVTAFLLGAIVSVVMVNRCKEHLKNVANNKMSYKEIMANVLKKSMIRLSLLLGAFVLAGVIMIAVAPAYLKALGVHLILVAVAGFYSAVSADVLWPLFKGADKSKRAKTESTAE